MSRTSGVLPTRSRIDSAYCIAAEDSAPERLSREPHVARRRPPRRPTRLRDVAGHRREEDVALERQQLDSVDRPDRRRPRARRGAARSRRTTSPGPWRRTVRPSISTSTSPVVDDVEPVAGSPFADEPGAGRRRDRDEVRGEALDRRRRRAGRTSGSPAGASSRTWTTAAASTPRSVRQRRATTSGSHRPTTTSARVRRRGQMISGHRDRAERDHPHVRPLEHTEDAGQAASGVTRWRSVRPATSSVAPPDAGDEEARPAAMTSRARRRSTRPARPRRGARAPSGPPSRAPADERNGGRGAERSPPTPAARGSRRRLVGPRRRRSIAGPTIRRCRARPR